MNLGRQLKSRDELSELAAELLAVKLNAAGQTDRLLSLFADDRWLTRRVTDGRGGWPGFRADLNVASAALAERGRDQPSSATIVHAVRLGLISATIRSVGLVGPRLVAAAQRVGAWNEDRALAEIAAYDSVGRRVEGVLTLLAQGRATNSRRLLEQLERFLLGADERVSSSAFWPIAATVAPELQPVIADLMGAHGKFADTSARALMSKEDEAAVTVADVLAALNRLPGLQRPALVTTLLDTLLADLPGPPLTPADEPAPAPPRWEDGNPTPLMERTYQAEVDAVYGEPGRRHDIAAALRAGSSFVHLHRDEREFLARLATAIPQTFEPEQRRDLIAAFAPAAKRQGVVWPTRDDPPVPSDDDDARRARDLHQELVSRRLGRPASARFASWGIPELQNAWLGHILPLPAGPPHAETPPDEVADDGAPSPELLAQLQRVGTAVFIAALATAQGAGNDEIDQAVRQSFSPVEFDGQMIVSGVVYEMLDEPDGRPALRRARGALVAAAIEHGSERQDPSKTWLPVEDDALTDLDWEPVIDSLIGLPTGRERSSIDRFTGRDAVQPLPPFADALGLVVELWDRGVVEVPAEQIAERLVPAIAAIADPQTQREARELLAPHLPASAVKDGLSAAAASDGGREQAWALGELLRALGDEHPAATEVHRWHGEAVEGVRDGIAAGALLHARRERGELTDEDVIAVLRRLDDNHRADALKLFAYAAEGELSAALTGEILTLPAVNRSRRYSARSDALSTAGGKLPAECLDAVWTACRELPTRLSIGDSHLWGWHWSHEYPLAATISALAPQLSDSAAAEAVEHLHDVPWFVREESLRTLAQTADAPLARAIFDSAMARFPAYLALDDDATVPFPLEGSVVTQPVFEFKVWREVQLAEIIAATAEQLDLPRLRAARDQACRFANEGPRAWLPVRLLPLLPAQEHEPMLSSAALAAEAFMLGDPQRIDMLTGLLPFMADEIERRRRPYDEFMQARFADHQGPPTREQMERLSDEEADEVRRLLGIDELARRHRDDLTDDERRAILEREVLSPMATMTLEQRLTRFALEAPLDSRIRALGPLQAVLDEAHIAQLISATVAELRGGAMAADAVPEALEAMLGFLDGPACEGLLELAFALPGGPVGDAEVLGRRVADALLLDWTKALRPDPRFTPFGAFGNALGDHWDQQTYREAFDVRRPRVAALRALAAELTSDGWETLLSRLGELAELERADAVAALLELEGSAPVDALIDALRDLRDPFARYWALFHTQNQIAVAAHPWVSDYAWETVHAFADPVTRVGLLVLLSGRAGERRESWIDVAFDEVGRLTGEDALKVALVLARWTDKRDAAIARRFESLETAAQRFRGTLAMCRLGRELSDEFRHVSGRPAIEWLEQAGRSTRPDFLRELAGATPLLAPLAGPDGVVEIARCLHEIDVEWRWP